MHKHYISPPLAVSTPLPDIPTAEGATPGGGLETLDAPMFTAERSTHPSTVCNDLPAVHTPLYWPTVPFLELATIDRKPLRIIFVVSKATWPLSSKFTHGPFWVQIAAAVNREQQVCGRQNSQTTDPDSSP